MIRWLLVNEIASWNKGSLLECLESWISDKSTKAHRALPCYTLWRLWLSRNKLTFHDKSLSIGQVAHSIRMSYRECCKAPIMKAAMIFQGPTIVISIAQYFFNGTNQGVSNKCRVGLVLHVSSLHYFSLKCGAGLGSNNRVDFFSLQIFLKQLQIK